MNSALPLPPDQVKPPALQAEIGLILTGGGARAAYQVGVLQAISEMLPPGARNPFPIICGTSAGAINATALAVSATRFHEGVKQLSSVWENFHVHQVYRADPLGAFGNSARWAASFLLNTVGNGQAVSLLDNAPLAELLKDKLPFKGIARSIHTGALRALSISASGYTSGQSVTFFQGAESVTPWRRARRIGIAAQIGVEHLMASSAIPLLFPAVKLNREYFGDGSMRQVAPISPALHLGAEKVLVIGVKRSVDTPPQRAHDPCYPPLAQIAGHVMSSIFLDSLDMDLERLQRINRTVGLISPEARAQNGMTLKHIEVMVISPSEEINAIAERYAGTLPRTLRVLFRAIGAKGAAGAALLSYVLFEAPFCHALIELGHRDTMARKEEVLKFLGGRADKV